jgi:hypothetical protein
MASSGTSQDFLEDGKTSAKKNSSFELKIIFIVEK